MRTGPSRNVFLFASTFSDELIKQQRADPRGAKSKQSDGSFLDKQSTTAAHLWRCLFHIESQDDVLVYLCCFVHQGSVVQAAAGRLRCLLLTSSPLAENSWQLLATTRVHTHVHTHTHTCESSSFIPDTPRTSRINNNIPAKARSATCFLLSDRERITDVSAFASAWRAAAEEHGVGLRVWEKE